MFTTFHPPTVEYDLDGPATSRLRADMLTLAESGVRPAEPEFYDRHWLDVELLPVGLRDFLQRFRMTESHESCVVRGVPVDDVAIPTQWAGRVDAVADLILALCALSLGDPFASASVQDGRMIQNFLPYGDNRRDVHTVAEAHHDYLLLLAMTRTPVGLVSVRDLELDEKTRAVLAQQRFIFEWGWASMLFGNPGDPYLRVDRCRPGDPGAAQALAALRSELDRVRQDVELGAGSLLVIDNYRTAHGLDGSGWLKRITVSRNLRRVTGDGCHPRVLD